MLLALLLASLAEGIGLSALLPLLNLAIRQTSEARADGSMQQDPNQFEQMVLDQLDMLGLSPTIGILLTIVVTAVTVKSGLMLLAQKNIGYTAAQIATDLRLDMLRAMLATRWDYFLRQPIGRYTNSLATEAKRASGAFIFGVTLIMIVIQAMIYSTIALMVSWQATVIAVVVGLGVMLILRFLVRMARKAGKKQTKLLKSLLTRLIDTLQSVKPLKAMAMEGLADSVLTMETGKLNKALQRQVFSMAVLAAAQEELFVIIIAIGMYLALVHWEMPLATVMVLVLLLGKTLSQLGKIQKQYQKMVTTESAFWSLQKTIKEAEAACEQLSGGVSVALERGIRLTGVGFSYESHPILKGLSMDIPAGSLTTIIGPSGSGKTTLVDLVIGLLKPQEGEIVIDGISMNEVDIKGWRRKIGYVPQENLLLHDTILHNVTLGDPELDEGDAEYALRAAGAWEFVSRIPEGMLSIVGERGGKLSGGQRQRIMIARALAHKPRLLILDEATSALDPASEAAISDTMERLRGGLTILAISHQTALVNAADRVYRMEKQGVILSPSPGKDMDAPLG
jgi:ATP-binding cassette subfamily C protein